MSTTLGIYAHVSNPRIITYRADKPQLRELLTQGVLAGCFALTIYACIYSFFISNYYKPLIIGKLHELLAIGALTGLAHGLVYWCYAHLFHARFRGIARFLTAVAVVAVGYGILEFLAPSPSVHVPLLTAWFGAQVISLSVMTGSQRRPWRAFIFGVNRVNSRQRLPASVIGLVLRVTLLFLCFESIFLFVCVLQMNEELRDFVIWWLVVVDFVIGLVIALVNPRFWLTLSLAIVVNAPWIYLPLLFPNEPGVIKIIVCSYLLLWCGFLVTRCRILDPLFSSIRQELRYYYLVD